MSKPEYFSLEHLDSVARRIPDIFPNRRKHVERWAVEHSYDTFWILRDLYKDQSSRQQIIQLWREHIVETEFADELNNINEDEIEVCIYLIMLLHDVPEELAKLSQKLELSQVFILLNYIQTVLNVQHDIVLTCIHFLTEQNVEPFTKQEFSRIKIKIQEASNVVLDQLSKTDQHWFITKKFVIEKLKKSSQFIVFCKSIDVMANLRDTLTEFNEMKAETKGSQGAYVVLNRYKGSAILKLRQFEALAKIFYESWPENPLLPEIKEIIRVLRSDILTELSIEEKASLYQTNPFLKEIDLQPDLQTV